MPDRVLLVSPRGFCAGVDRAIATVERALAVHRSVYVRRAIVHNARVTARLAAMGALFVDELNEVPIGAVVVLGAHGVPAAVYEQARARRLRVVDATCPLISKVHREVRSFHDLGYDVVLIGHAGHDEVVGTLGQVPGVHLVERASDVDALTVRDPERVACVTQTTLSPSDIAPLLAQMRRRFPRLVQPLTSDICYATRNRQAAATWLAANADVVLVVGDRSSSNTQRLAEAVIRAGKPAHLLPGVAELDDRWLNCAVIGVCAGASTPVDAVDEVVDYLSEMGATREEIVMVKEATRFPLPRIPEGTPGRLVVA